MIEFVSLALHGASTVGGAQFYASLISDPGFLQSTDNTAQIECAQIAVTGSGSGTPGPVRFLFCCIPCW